MSIVSEVCRYVVYEAQDVITEEYSMPEPEDYFWDAEVCAPGKDPLNVEMVYDWENRDYPDGSIWNWPVIDLVLLQNTVLKFDLFHLEHEDSVLKYECVAVKDDYYPTMPSSSSDRDKYNRDQLEIARRTLWNVARWNCQTSRYFSDGPLICKKATVLEDPEADDYTAH